MSNLFSVDSLSMRGTFFLHLLSISSVSASYGLAKRVRRKAVRWREGGIKRKRERERPCGGSGGSRFHQQLPECRMKRGGFRRRVIQVAFIIRRLLEREHRAFCFSWRCRLRLHNNRQRSCYAGHGWFSANILSLFSLVFLVFFPRAAC